MDLVEWVIMKHKALLGNMLITGSIGGGKTNGTILPFFDQILSNFDPKPAILAIDPKRTFVKEALSLIEKHGLKDSVLHLKLGGNVTFNPIYQKNALKDAGFAEMAQMIRAAQANFEGGGSKNNSSFWEMASYNLTKSAIAYCAATKGYYTLNDLYDTLVRAANPNIAKELELCLREERFDVEEKGNIAFAMQYFAEEYGKLEEELRTSILATATSFLNQFREYQASQIFCPKEEDLTIRSMDDLIDNGKILLYDIGSSALSKSMGTFVKLHYQQSLLNRIEHPTRKPTRPSVLIIDEYQDFASVGNDGTLGDDKFLSKSKDSNSITIVASQSLTSLRNALRNDRAAEELIQHFRTRIVGHSSDMPTIRNYQELMGEKEVEKKTHSISEQARHTRRNLINGGFETPDANISESVSTSEQKEYAVTAKDFARLKTFECYMGTFDGVGVTYKKLFLKPFFLEDKRTPHKKILEFMKASVGVLLMGLLIESTGFAFPNVCSVVKTSEFTSCLGYSVGACMCGYPPHPCAQISYYVPQTFIEVMPDPKDSNFEKLPGAAMQLKTAGAGLPYGAEADDDSHSSHGHTIAVPLATIPFSLLSCGGARTERFCFDGMSEHLGSNWSTGQGDLLQPNFLAWSLSPKACLLKGAVTSIMGDSEGSQSDGTPSCSVPMAALPKYPPSKHSACNGWGIFYPRVGTYNGVSQAAGALMIASRIKSLSMEVFNTTPGSSDELWQMISPQTSSCFREGQNVGITENIKNVRELGRFTTGKFKGFLFVVWSKVNCCEELATVAKDAVAIGAMSVACQGPGNL